MSADKEKGPGSGVSQRCQVQEGPTKNKQPGRLEYNVSKAKCRKRLTEKTDFLRPTSNIISGFKKKNGKPARARPNTTEPSIRAR